MTIERNHIGIFGRVNVGKSTLMNILFEAEVSIVDKKPGTTADIKTGFMEIHDIGPIKVYDTAGVDEKGELGEKKKRKSFDAISECDLVLLVIDPDRKDLTFEKQIADLAKKREKQLLIIYNIFKEKEKHPSNTLKKTARIDEVLRPKKSLICNFKKVSKGLVLEFIVKNFSLKKTDLSFFNDLKKGDVVFFNIPMDDETPEKRLLRPQALVLEKFTRKYISTFVYRMDLKAARSKDQKEKEKEMQRFQNAIELLKEKNSLKLLITDSQAIDVIHPWTLKDNNPVLPITTFSVIMAHLTSGGRIKEFVKGLKALSHLKKGDKILIAEACSHNRIAEDIGTVQIPKKIEAVFGKDIVVEHLFGKEFNLQKLSSYNLVIHCGGCMLDSQRIDARLNQLIDANVSFTNYGIFLAYMQSKEALKRVVAPFI